MSVPPRTGTGLFAIEWQDEGGIALRANNNKFVTAKMNGSLYAVSDSIANKETFIMTIINRPVLILKGEYGFMGFKSQSNPRIECNKASHDYIYLEHTGGQSGVYYLKGWSRAAFWFVAPWTFKIAVHLGYH